MRNRLVKLTFDNYYYVNLYLFILSSIVYLVLYLALPLNTEKEAYIKIMYYFMHNSNYYSLLHVYHFNLCIESNVKVEYAYRCTHSDASSQSII